MTWRLRRRPGESAADRAARRQLTRNLARAVADQAHANHLAARDDDPEEAAYQAGVRDALRAVALNRAATPRLQRIFEDITVTAIRRGRRDTTPADYTPGREAHAR